MNNSLYIYTDVNRREELTLISLIGRVYLKKIELYRYTHGNNSHRNSLSTKRRVRHKNTYIRI